MSASQTQVQPQVQSQNQQPSTRSQRRRKIKVQADISMPTALQKDNQKKLPILSRRQYKAKLQKPINAWTHYVKDHIKATLGDTFQAKMKVLSGQWKSLDNKQKEPFVLRWKANQETFQAQKKALTPQEKRILRQYRRERSEQRRDGQELPAKRALTAYACFIKANRQSFKDYTGEKKTKLRDVSRILRDKWVLLNAAEKTSFKTRNENSIPEDIDMKPEMDVRVNGNTYCGNEPEDDDSEESVSE